MARFATYLLLAIALATAPRAVAQAGENIDEAYLQEQVIRMLDAPAAHAEAVALHLIIYYESREGAEDEQTFSFEKAAPQLVEIVRSATDDKRRILAETALHLSDEDRWQELDQHLALHEAPRRLR